MSATIETHPAVTIHVGDKSSATYQQHRQYLTHISDGVDLAPVTEQVIDIGHGMTVLCQLHGTHLFIGPNDGDFPWLTWSSTIPPDENETLATIKVVGKGMTKEVMREYQWYEKVVDGWGYARHRRIKVNQVDCYLPGMSVEYQHYFEPTNPSRVPYIYLTLDITAFGVSLQKELRFRLPDTGKVTLEKDAQGLPRLQVDVEAFGVTHTIYNDFCDHTQTTYYGSPHSPLEVLYKHIQRSDIDQGKDGLWAVFLTQHGNSNPPMNGLSALYKRKAFKANFARLEAEAPLDWAFLRWLQDKATSEGRKNNQLISAFFTECAADYDKLFDGLQVARTEAVNKTSDWRGYAGLTERDGFPARRAICMELPGAAENWRSRPLRGLPG